MRPRPRNSAQLTELRLTYVGPMKIWRLAFEQGLDEREVYAALLPAASSAADTGASPTVPSPDYLVRTLVELEAAAGRATEQVQRILRNLMAEAASLGVKTILFPGVRSSSRDPNRLLVVEPAFVGAAHYAEPVELAKRTFEVKMRLEKRAGRGLTAARRHIEEIHLARVGARQVGKDKERFRFELPAYLSPIAVSETMAELIDELHRVATNNDCSLELSIRDLKSRERWD